MRKKLFLSCFIAIAGLTACSNSDDGGQVNNAEQVFEINISNASGNTLTRAGRPLYGSQASQAVDHVVVYVTKPDGEVIYIDKLDNWRAISSDYGNGKRYTFKLTGDKKLEAGTYKLAAYAYSTDGKAPEYSILGAMVPTGLPLAFDGKAEEVFAGESELVVAGSPAVFTSGNTVVLERHVAGAFGYFTRIPAVILDKPTAKVRLVASVKNTTANLGNATPKQINGSVPAVADVKFENGTPAFEVYSANILDWFSEGDKNADGFFGAGDTWNIPTGLAGLNVLDGTIMAGEFLVSAAKHASANTFELQLLATDGSITKSWNVAIPAGSTDVENTRHQYNIYRNHLYGIGEKTLDNPEDPTTPGGEDKENPEDLSKDQDIIINISSEWEVLHKLELE